MATVMKLIGANFSGRGLPNIAPFIEMDDLNYAYDFRDKSLTDYTGNTTLRALKNDINGNEKLVEDSSIVSPSVDGLGIVVDMGVLELNQLIKTIPLGGAEQFTIMVVGGYSGVPFNPDDISGSNPTICSLYDYGTGISSSGFSIEVTPPLVTAGSRIEDGVAGLNTNLQSAIEPVCLFLTFDGNSWSLVNKTNGTTQTKTNAELNISSNPLVVSTAYSNKVKLGGHFHGSSTLAALAPVLYQSAKWLKVLTPDEIEEQYNRTKATFGVIGI